MHISVIDFFLIIDKAIHMISEPCMPLDVFWRNSVRVQQVRRGCAGPFRNYRSGSQRPAGDLPRGPCRQPSGAEPGTRSGQTSTDILELNVSPANHRDHIGSPPGQG